MSKIKTLQACITFAVSDQENDIRHYITKIKLLALGNSVKMLSSARREMFRALRNQLKISWKKNGPINSEKSRRNRNRFAAVVATAAASIAVGSVAVKNSERVLDEDLRSKPLGSVYNFQGW